MYCYELKTNRNESIRFRIQLRYGYIHKAWVLSEDFHALRHSPLPRGVHALNNASINTAASSHETGLLCFPQKSV